MSGAPGGQTIAELRRKAETAFRAGHRDEGFEAAMRAYALNPSDVAYGLDCAYNLVRAGRRSDALTVSELLAGQAMPSPEHSDTLGTIFTHCELPARALPFFEQACRAQPRSSSFLFNLASAQRMVGDVQSAERNLTFAITLNPGWGDLYLARSQLRRQTTDSNHVDEMKAALSAQTQREGRIAIGYALAKELEDIGEYSESFRHLAQASKTLRQGMSYDVRAEISLLEDLVGPESARAGQPDDTAQAQAYAPIFVFGLPRSGTTLTERILASCGQTASAGEPNTLMASAWNEGRKCAAAAGPTGIIREAIRQRDTAIAQSYMRTMQNQFGDARIIDKTPTNYLFPGLIASSMPNARMVCVRRGSMDSCYAMFKMQFTGSYAFSYDLAELADYYIAWDRAMAQWEASIGDALMVVRYEELVRNPEPTMRKLVAHCRLDWTDDCLRFHDLPQPVTSASAGQVNQPLSEKSIGLWRRYEAELSPLADRLTAAGIPLD